MQDIESVVQSIWAKHTNILIWGLYLHVSIYLSICYRHSKRKKKLDVINSGVNIWTLEDVSEFVCMKKMYAYQLEKYSCCEFGELIVFK